MKKYILSLILFLFVGMSLSAQSYAVIEPTVSPGSLSYSDQLLKDWSYYEQTIIPRLNDNGWAVDKLTDADRRAISKLKLSESDLDLESSPFMLVGPGCSWYCGAMYETKVSSALPSTAKNNYGRENLSDDDTRTAWVEGVKGYGVGEYIEFIFPYAAARATSCMIANGYNKNALTWKNNSRVKTFNVYENDKLIAIVNLKDTRDLQSFYLPHPIPNRPDDFDSSNYDYQNPAMPPTVLRFMITEVYKGDKYDDTAISELIFNGRDVHCLAQGTDITMADGKKKNIEDIVAGDEVLSYNTDAKKTEVRQVKRLHRAQHKGTLMINLDSEDDEQFIITTDDHPFFTPEGWKSYNPQKTMQYKRYPSVSKYKEGDSLLTYRDGRIVPVAIISIDNVVDTMQTYTLELEGEGAFIANGLLVGQE